MRQQDNVRESICDAVLRRGSSTDHSTSALQKTTSAVKAIFSLYDLQLRCHEPEVFKDLRSQWHLDESIYDESFTPSDALQSEGDMGYSGSTFFTTKDGKFIVKSVPRRFEHTFFRDDLFIVYTTHVKKEVNSLLIRIADFLEPAHKFNLAGKVGTAPTHHIVMENLLTGKAEAEKQALSSNNNGSESESNKEGKWETWDLKPTSYFFPERDIAGGKLTSEATKSKLADKFEDKIILSKNQADKFFEQLESDTLLLQRANAVDYSLFLVRIPLSKPQNPFADDAEAAARSHPFESVNAPIPPTQPPFAPPDPPSWRTGIESADGKYVFRAAVLDFFWAKHKVHAKCMTALISCWNLVDWGQGPMSITTTPEDYRSRFLDMCRKIVEVKMDEQEDVR